MSWVQARSSYKCHLMQHPLHDWMPTAFPPPGVPASAPMLVPLFCQSALFYIASFSLQLH